MEHKIQMPRMGESVQEGTIIKWLVLEGGEVTKDEPFVEISTDKIDTEIPAPVSGKLIKIEAREGETIKVGNVIAVIETESSERTSKQGPDQDKADAGKLSGKAYTLAGFISPLIRKIAKENQIDLSQIKGTGKEGRITKNDILQFISDRSAAVKKGYDEAKAAFKEEAGKEEYPQEEAFKKERGKEGLTHADQQLGAKELPVRDEFQTAPAIKESHITPKGKAVDDVVSQKPPRGRDILKNDELIYPTDIMSLAILRKQIAKHLLISKNTYAPVTSVIDADLTVISELRAKVKDRFKEIEGFSLTYLPFIARATTEALEHFPILNARVEGENVVLHHYVNLGIAVSVENGLIVPVIKRAESLSLVGLARQIHEIAERARNRKLINEDVMGGTFTITNPGGFGTILSTPIINYPESAILSTERVRRLPVVVGDEIAIRDIIYLCLSWDHRLMDGADAAKFLARIKENLGSWDFSHELTAYQ